MQAPDGKKNGILDWPEPVPCATYQEQLQLAKLDQKEKASLWEDLKANNPTKAKALKTLANDPFVLALISEFGASLTVESTDLSPEMYGLLKHHFE